MEIAVILQQMSISSWNVENIVHNSTKTYFLYSMPRPLNSVEKNPNQTNMLNNTVSPSTEYSESMSNILSYMFVSAFFKGLTETYAITPWGRGARGQGGSCQNVSLHDMKCSDWERELKILFLMMWPCFCFWGGEISAVEYSRGCDHPPPSTSKYRTCKCRQRLTQPNWHAYPRGPDVLWNICLFLRLPLSFLNSPSPADSWVML